MKEKVKTILKYILSAAAALLLLWFSFKGVKWSDFKEVFIQCKWHFVALSMLSGVLSFLVRALRWKLLLLPVDSKTSLISCYDGVTIGNLSNFVVQHLGEFVRCGYVVGNSEKIGKTKHKASYDKVLGTVVLERVWDMIMLAVLLAVLLVLKWSEFGTFFVEKIIRPTATQADSILGIAIAASVIALALGCFIVIKFKDRSRLCRKCVDFFKGIWNGVVSFTRMEKKFMFLLYTVLLWLMFLMMSYFIIKAMPGDYGLDFVDAMFLMLVGAVASIVPVPGGFGAFHYLLALSLSSIYAIPWEMGIIFATLSHETQAFTMIVTGLLSYSYESLKKKE